MESFMKKKKNESMKQISYFHLKFENVGSNTRVT